MSGWLAENYDYLLFIASCLILFGSLDAWLRRRKPSGALPLVVWPLLLALLVYGWFSVSDAGRAESRRIRDFLQGVAPTYAQEIMRMGHHRLTLESTPDNVDYLRMIAGTKRWKEVNPTISDVYTFRLVDGVVRLMVSSETDYNHDGKFEGPREQRIPIGKPYHEADPDMLLALQGERTFSEEPVRDEWGVWVSAQVPLLDEAGRVEGALGVDYPAEKWVAAIQRGRQRMMWLLAIPVLILGFTTATTGALSAEIAARRNMERRLRESEARLMTAIDSIPFDFWVMDLDRRYVLINAASRQHWGDCVGGTLADLNMSPEAQERWSRVNERTFQGEVTREEVFQEVDGEMRFLHAITAPVRVGEKIVGILGINLDLTERKQAEEALRRSEHRFALHVKQTPLAVVEWDPEFRVTAWNPAAERIFGYTAEEALGQNGTEFLVVDSSRDHVAQIWKSLTAGEGGWRSTNENGTKDGRIITCDWHNTYLVDDDGKVIGVASHCEDVTHREIMEKHLRQTQKIESLGQLAAGVAHEFNNLLTPMLLRLEMLRSDRADDADLIAALRSIGDAIDQAAQLNQRILAVGRRPVEKRELIALNPVVDDTLGLLRHTIDKRVVLDVRLASGLGLLLLDRAQVSQVVVNLTLNARDAVLDRQRTERNPEWRARIEVSTTEVDAVPRNEVEGGAPAATLRCQRLTIADTGMGMSDEVRMRAFDPFYTTKPPGQGTGLGLAVVWTVVKHLDGWIEVNSEPGKGAVFHVYFPVPKSAAAAAPAAPVVETPVERGDNLRILLVDDNVFVADTISRMLMREGHQVSYAANGEEAWSLCSDEAQAFDLVMTDQNMPVMTGLELVRRLRHAKLPTRMIVVSGHLSPELLKELEALGVEGMLAKPFTQKALLTAVRNAVSGSPAPVRPWSGQSV